MIAGKNATSETAFNGGLWWYGPGTITTVGGVEPPDCNTIPAWCFTSWGIGFFSYDNWLLGKKEAGAFTGFVSARKALQSNAAYADGHVKFSSPAGLAAGTNWTWTINTSDLVVTDKAKYLWDLN